MIGDIGIEIFKALGEARQNYELGKNLGDLIVGQGLDDLEKGREHLKSIKSSGESQKHHAKAALTYFNKIDDNNKKYIRALKSFYKAQCYGHLSLFDDAISELDKLKKIEVTYGTYKSQMINECKSDGEKLRQIIYEIIKETEEIYEQIKRRKRRRRNIIITAFIIAIIILCIVIYKFILNN